MLYLVSIQGLMIIFLIDSLIYHPPSPSYIKALIFNCVTILTAQVRTLSLVKVMHHVVKSFTDANQMAGRQFNMTSMNGVTVAVEHTKL